MSEDEDYPYSDGEMEEEEEDFENEKNTGMKIEEEKTPTNVQYESIDPEKVDTERSKMIMIMQNYIQNEIGTSLPIHQIFEKLKKANFHPETAKALAYDHICDMIKLNRGMSKIELNDPYLCEICWIEGPLNSMVGLECKHLYCEQCYKIFVLSSVKNDVKSAVYLTCPNEGCEFQVTGSIISRLLDKKEMERLQRFIRRDFQEKAYNLLPCLNDSCEKSFLLKYQGNDKRKLKQTDLWCECLYSRCNLCEKECHTPAPCDAFELWLKKIEGKDDSVTQSWIKSNTKTCPNGSCHVQIEKNQGCMHMTCAKCRHEFCWLCMGPWSEHGESTGGYYSCNKFKGDKDNLDVEKRELEKFNHYSSRYIEHAKSVKLNRASLQKVQILIENGPMFKNFSRQQFDFYIHAHHVSMRTRQTVTISYGLSYQILSDNERELLDMNLSYLQMRLEHLTKFLEEVHCECWFEANHLNKKFAEDRQEIIARTEKVEENIRSYIKDTMKPEKLDSFFNKKNMVLIKNNSVNRSSSLIMIPGWTCNACTLHNNDEDALCIACNTARLP